jgi:hypothetical protein
MAILSHKWLRYIWVDYRSTDLDDMQKAQNNQDDSDHDQRVNPTAGLRKPWTDSPAKEAEQPQNY